MSNGSATQSSLPMDEIILIPGFAGHLDTGELANIKVELRKSSSLRRRWGFRPSAKQLNNKYIRHVALHGVPKDKKLVLASLRRRKKRAVVH
jgi:hypothetical protein